MSILDMVEAVEGPIRAGRECALPPPCVTELGIELLFDRVAARVRVELVK